MRGYSVNFAVDLFLWAVAGPIAFLLSVDNAWSRFGQGLVLYTLLGLPVKATFIIASGLHRQAWRKVGIRDLHVLIKALGLGTLALIALTFFVRGFFPRSVPLIEAGSAFFLLGGIRFATRFWSKHKRALNEAGRRVLIVGAGECGTIIARELFRHPEAGLQPVGFLDDDLNKRKRRILGVPVLGGLEDLPQVAKRLQVQEVLIALPSAPGQVVRRAVELARGVMVPHRIIPAFCEILSGKVALSEIREVRVEDLLRRQPVTLDLEEIGQYLKSRVILITGAGGSIGSEIFRQVVRCQPQLVILLGRGENSLFHVEQEIHRNWPNLGHRVVVGDLQNRLRLEQIFAQNRPEVVFHAAAHKHVPLMECNPEEAVFNNVLGTRNLVELSLAYDVERFVNISTDKAVRPSSIMGASKRVAEYLVDWAASVAKPNQIFVSVRFGNVLGSRGSVVPIFQEQIRAGGPVTVTHPEARRYFMTIAEAAQLVLQAGGVGENGALYLLEMGEPVRILDLARDLIRLSGLEPERDIPIRFIGLRAGEKLFEELMNTEEELEPSQHPKILKVRKHTCPEEKELSSLLETLFSAARSGDGEAVRRAFIALIPDFQEVPLTATVSVESCS